MNARIQKWGNSLAVRIPKAFADEINFTDKTDVALSIVNGSLVISPKKLPHYTLDELIAGVTDENRHDEIDFGPPVGKEKW